MFEPEENKSDVEKKVSDLQRDYERDPWAESEPQACVEPERKDEYLEAMGSVENKEKPVKKQHSFFEKASLLVVSAVLFGAIAGGVFVGVTALDRYFEEKKAPKDKIELDGTSETDENEKDDSTPVEIPETGVVDREDEADAMQVSVMDVSSVVESVMPAVVAINCYSSYSWNNWYGREEESSEVMSGAGSGIIVGQNEKEILIVTNNHVIEGASRIAIEFVDGTSVDGTVKGTAPSSDLAVVTVRFDAMDEETLSTIRVARLGNSDEVVVGQMAIAIGNALGYGQSVTVGYISAKDRQVTVENVTYTLIQTDAAINPGNSGGALLNKYGEVIGINSVKYSDSEVEGMGFAIPISNIAEIIADLSTREEVEESEQGYLGIQVGKDISQEYANMLGIPQGLYVSDVVKNSPAHKGGLYVGDIIVKVDKITIAGMDDLKSFLSHTKAGTEVTIVVQRLKDGEYVEVSLQVTLGNKPTE